MLKNTSNSYGSVAKFFHWMIFLLIGVLLIMGEIMGDLPTGPDKFKVYGLHKSIGICVLMLAAVRLLWRWVNPSPVLPAHMRNIEKLMAHIGHYALYALMFAMPLSGWMMSSAAGFPVSVFGLFTLPDMVLPDPSLKATMSDMHELLATAIMVIVTLHILAALFHHVYHKDNVLKRMLPFCKD